MTTYQYFDTDGWFTDSLPADPHPIRPGEFMPAPWGATIEQVPEDVPAGHRARFVSGAWQVQPWTDPTDQPLSLDKLKEAQVLRLSMACEVQIVDGFKSAALGAPYLYPAKLTDQVNLQASVVESIVPGLEEGWTTPFWCADVDGAWVYRPHTATQIQRVGRDAKAAILAALERKALLEARVAAATSPEAVAAVVWNETAAPEE